MGRHADDSREAIRAARRNTIRVVPRRRFGTSRIVALVVAAAFVGYAAIGILSSPRPGSPARLEQPVAGAMPTDQPPTATESATAPTPPTPNTHDSVAPISSDDSPAAPDWRSILVALDQRRTAAFATLDAAALTAVYVDGSPPLLLDRASLAELVAARVHAVGLHLDLESLTPLEAGAEHAVLAVTDRLEPYALVSAAGVDAHPVAGRDAMRWRIDLAKEEGVWQIADVRPCPEGACGQL